MPKTIYDDDTFLLFASESHFKKFHKYLRHDNIVFTFETELDDKIPFLNVFVSVRYLDAFLVWARRGCLLFWARRVVRHFLDSEIFVLTNKYSYL